VIPVTKIHGPILLDCGGADLVWVSCQYGTAIMAALTAAHDAEPHALFSYPSGGHAVGELAPYEPGTQLNRGDLMGSSRSANSLAVANLWPKVLAFLNS